MSNLEDLDMKLLAEVERYQAGRMESYRAALEGGRLLIQARETLPHGEFGPFCQRAGLNRRTAQRWMQLAHAGLSAEGIAKLGGLRRAEESLSKCDRRTHLPGETADDLRRAELERETAELRQRLGERLADATAAELVGYVKLTHSLETVNGLRGELNGLIEEGQTLRDERDTLLRRKADLEGEIAR